MDAAPAPSVPRAARWGRVRVALIASAVAIAAVAVGYIWLRPSGQRAEVAAPAPAPSTVAPAPPPAPVPTPPPPPPRPVVAHDHVPAAVPTAFTLTGSGSGPGSRFTVRARVCAMPAVFPLDPPGEQHHTVCWVKKGFGVRPGSSTGTSYVLGHSWAEDEQEVLNPASEPATRDVLRAKPQLLDGVPIRPAPSLVGAKITLRTPRGTLVYAVRSAYGVDKMKLGSITRVMDQHIRNRVVVITCAELHGVDYDYNIVLDARLVSSRRTSSA
jgi:hypothetical protein